MPGEWAAIGPGRGTQTGSGSAGCRQGGEPLLWAHGVGEAIRKTEWGSGDDPGGSGTTKGHDLNGTEVIRGDPSSKGALTPIPSWPIPQLKIWQARQA